MQVVEIVRPPAAPYYSPSSFFNRLIGSSDSLKADQSQAQHVANQLQYGKPGHTFFGYSGVGYGNYEWPYSIGLNATSYSFPVFVVSNSTPKQKVGTYSHTGTNYYAQFPNLQAVCNAVPIPDKALCPKITGTAPYVDIWAGGTDQEIFIWNKDTDEGWEFWLFSNANANGTRVTGATWTAQYGGYMPSVTNFSGVFPNQWGAKATSLGGAGGMITLQDMRNVQAGGSINHALCFALGMNGGASGYVAPATRGDGPGSNNMASIPSGFPNAGQPNPAYHMDASFEGGRFCFPKNIDLSGVPSGMALEIAKAVRDYGTVLTDTTGAGAFYIEDPRTLGSPYHLQGASAVDPWSLSWPAGNPFLVSGDPSGYTVLNHLPWDQLQVLTPVVS